MFDYIKGQVEKDFLTVAALGAIGALALILIIFFLGSLIA